MLCDARVARRRVHDAAPKSGADGRARPGARRSRRAVQVTADDIKEIVPRVMRRGRELESGMAAVRPEVEGF